jgi:hypothetical protein
LFLQLSFVSDPDNQAKGVSAEVYLTFFQFLFCFLKKKRIFVA